MNTILYQKPSCGDLDMHIYESILSLSAEGNTINDATIDSWDEEL